jgi:CheY-like chemotaxis protein
MFELQARNKGLQFKFEQHGELPALVRADQKRLTQILINILGNAVKFTKQGSVTFKVSYAREIAHIEVHDTGPGISPAEYEKIFEPFERGTAADQINIGGTGLGLTISKLLTELMGGEMHFHSQVGIGTQFEIRLFLSQIRQDTQIEPVVQRKRIGYEGPRRKVLVVDNEQVDRELIVNILAPLGFEMAEAGTGQECLDIYQEFKPDIILMDLAMPMMDGWEASYIIRKVHLSEVPIAIVSANAYDKNLENAAGISSHDFMVKPVHVEELLDWIGKQLQIVWMREDEKKLAPIEVPMVPEPVEIILPSAQTIQSILDLVNVGYIKGLQQKLDAIEAEDAQYAGFVSLMRQFVAQFNLEAVKNYLQNKSP